MNIRCKSCQGTIWVESVGADPAHALVRCRRCGQHYRLTVPRRSRRAGRWLARSARALAMKHGVDLPGAYSVLLGIMDVEEVRELGHSGSSACRTRAAGPPAPRSADGAYDPAFHPAVAGGFLTPRQAIERGQREAYASILARRHRLSMKDAYAVADNRNSLLEAIRRRGAGRSEVKVRVRAGLWPPLKWISALVVPMALAAALSAWSGPLSRSARGASAGLVDGKRILEGAEGRVVLVHGQSPWSVLRDFCRTGNPQGIFEAVDVVPVVDGRGAARLGLLRDPADPGTLLAIRIREDLEADRWVAGDGESPVVATPAPPGAAAVSLAR